MSGDVGVWDAYDQWEESESHRPLDAELEVVADEDAYQAWAASMAEYAEL